MTEKRIVNTGACHRRVSPEELAEALGAKIIKVGSRVMFRSKPGRVLTVTRVLPSGDRRFADADEKSDWQADCLRLATPEEIAGWTKTTAHWFNRALNELPPALMGHDWFLACEANYHTPHGSPVRTLYAKAGKGYYSTDSTHKQAKRKVRELRGMA